MRVLSLSTVFPNPVQPHHGVFVRERLRRLAELAEITVVAPVPYFPGATGRMAGRPAGVVDVRQDGDLQVFHPRFWSPPGIAKSLDGYLYAASVRGLVERLHGRGGFDLIDAHFAYPDGFAAVQLGRRLRVPVTITLRGTLPDLARRPSRRWALRRALHGADALVAVSASLRQDAAALGVDPETVTVVPNGIDLDTFRPLDRAVARRRLGLRADGRLVLSVGALREVKGHDVTLRAAAQLRAEMPDVTVAIVGGTSVSDDRSEALHRLAADLRIQDAVTWAGPRPHAEIPLWLAAADVFVIASRREGCCNALLEALACGRPAVATAVGGNPEIVRSAELGELVPHGDAAAMAAALRRVLGATWDPERIRDHVRERSWEATADAVMRVWRGTLAGAVRAPLGGAVEWTGATR